MKTILLPSTRQINTTNSDMCQQVEYFAGNVVAYKSSMKCRQRSKWNFGRFVLLMAMMLLISSSIVQAATRTASVSGNWSNTATWGGAAVPTSADDVTINSGITVTVDMTANCNSLSFLSTATVNSNVNINSGITLTVAGAVTIPRQGTNVNTLAVGAGNLNAGSIAFTSGGTSVRHQITISTGTVTVTGNVTGTTGNTSGSIIFTGAGTLKLGGSIFVAGDGTLTTVSGSTVNYNGTIAQTVQTFNYVNLTISGSNTKTLAANTTITGDLNVSSGTLDLSTFTANRSAAGGTLTVAGTLVLRGTTGGQTGSNFPTNFSSLALAGGTVAYNTTGGGQTIYSTPTYATLTLGNTSGTQTAGGNINTTTLNNNTNTADILNMSTFTLSATTVNNTGTIRTQNTSGTPLPAGQTWGGTVQYDNAAGGQTVMTGTYGTLNNNNTSNTNTASGAITATNLNTSAGGTLNMSTFTLGLTNVTNAGTIRTQNTSLTPLPTGKTWGGTIQYDATSGGQTIMAGIYGVLNNNNTSNTNTASGTITATTLNTAANGTLNMSTFALGLTNVTNNGTIRTQNTSATPLPTGKTWGGTIQYDATTGAQTVLAGTYNNLTLSNTSGTQTASGALAVNGALTTTADGALNMGTNQLLGTLSTITNGGTIRTQNLTSTPISAGKTWGGTIQYDATTGAQTVMAGTYSNLTLSNTSGTQTASGALTVNGTLTTIAGGTLNMGTNQLLGTLNTITNGGIIRTQDLTSTPIPTGKTWGGTIQYDAATGGQTIMAGTFGILNSNNTSNINIASGDIAATTLNTTAGGTLNMSTFALSLTSVNNNGTIRTQNTSSTPISSGLTWGGTVTFDGSGAQTIPVSTFNNLSLNNSSGASIAGSVNVNTKLTLTTGILTTSSSNLLLINNTATTAISGGSTTSYINGPVNWALQPDMGTGTTYNFPVGNASYLPFALVNPITGAAPVIATVEAVTASSGGAANVDPPLVNKSNTEYWSLGTSGNFTGSAVSLGNPAGISPYNTIGTSTTLTGTYTTLGGTGTSTSITSTVSIGAGSNYFALASVASSLNVTALSPTSASTTYGTPSTNMTFDVVADGLVDGVLITPPSGFEVSSTPGGSTGFANTITVSGSGTTTIYVRLNATTNVGAYSGDINVTSNGVSPKTVTISNSTVNAKPLTATSTVTKAYDGTNAATTISLGTVSGYIGSQTLNITPSATAYSDAIVGDYSTTISYSLADGSGGGLAINYSMADLPTTGHITKKTLTAASTIAPKVYDGTTTVTGAITLGTVTGLVGTETLGITPSVGVLSSANVGSPATTIVYSLADGTGLASNYSMADLASTEQITPQPLTATSTVASKAYNNSAAAGTITLGTVSGYVGSETLVITPSATAYSSANVGTYNTTISYSLANGTGGLASNYTMASLATTGDIIPKSLTATSTVASKSYNNSTAAGTISLGTVSGLVNGQTLVITPSATAYASANVGSYSTTISYSLANGTGLASNYSMADLPTTGNITQKPLTATSTIASKVYDGSTTVIGTITLGTVTGLVNGETLIITPSAGALSSANVGSRTTSISYSLADGTGLASNYSMANLASTEAITAKPLTATSTVATKVYNNSTAAGTVTLGTVSGYVGSETLNITTSATAYSSANVGTYSTTISYTLTSGTGLASNYSMASFTTTGDITPASLTITANNVSKVYGNTLTDGPSSAFSQTGLVTGTISSVTVHYGSGAAATDAPNTYVGSVSPSNATGTFVPGNYNISYVPGNITVTDLSQCGATTLFSQDFSSGTNLATYTGTGTNQFDAFVQSSGTPFTITAGGALQVVRIAGQTLAFTKSTDLTGSPVPAILYKFTVNVTGTLTAGNDIAGWQVGTGFNSATNGRETGTNVYAQFSTDWVSGTTWRLNGTTTPILNTGTTYQITWILNNTSNTISYTNPNSVTETVGPDQQDLWIGTTEVRNDVAVTTPSGTISDLKFAWLAVANSAATVTMDNFLITTVSPVPPTVVKPSDQVVCEGSPTTAIDFTGSGSSSYLWTNDNPSIGISANGTGNIPSFIAVNTGTSPVVAHLTVTPSNGTCSGPSQSFTITVNPKPAITSVSTGIICSGVAQNYSINSSISNTTYSWSRAAVSGISNTSVSGQTSNPITETLFNTTTSPVDVIYLITPSVNNCPGDPFTYTVTVNAPMTAGPITGANAICVTNSSGIQLTSNATGTPTLTYAWHSSNPSVAIVTGGLVTPIDTGLTNITYTVTDGSSTGCQVTSAEFPIAVQAALTLNGTNVYSNSPLTSPLCVGETLKLFSPSGGPGTTYSWIRIGSLVEISNKQNFSIPNLTAANFYKVTISNACGTNSALTRVEVSPIPKLTINDVTVNEGDGTATFTVSLSQSVPCDVTFNAATANNTATGGTDYTTLVPTLFTIPKNTPSITIKVPIIDDNLVEPSESFYVNLSNPSNATILTGQGLGTIIDNDAALVSINSPSAVVEGTDVVFTVSVDKAVQGGFSVAYNTVDGSAVEPGDYTGNTGIIAFAGDPLESHTITVKTVDDAIVEPTENFTVSLGAITGAGNISIASDQGVGTGTITDNDIPNIVCPSDISQSTDLNSCSALVSIPILDYNTHWPTAILSWSISGTTTGSGTGQINNFTFEKGTSTVTYLVYDNISTNTFTCSFTVTVEDKEAPVISAIPATTTIDCSATPEFAVATATDNCDANPTITHEDVLTPGLCTGSYSITRTWTATDASNNSSQSSQTINVQDVTAPVISNLPAPTTIDSPATPVFEVATATDACGSAFTLNYIDVKTDGTCPGSYSVIRNWTATDACGNSSKASQTINVQDITAPVIAALPASTTIDSPATPVFEVATATDAAGSAFTLTYNDVRTDGVCTGSYSVTRTWTATDACGNSSTASQTINVQDVTAPVIAALPAPTTIDCPATPVFAIATATDAEGSAFTLTYNDVRTDGTCAGSYSVTRTWTATDACGNSSTASQTIIVQDITAPVIADLPAPTTIDCPDSPVFAVATATDACGSAFTLTYNDVRTDGLCAGSYSVTRTWTATDACGNSSTASQTIDVQDITAPVIADLPAPTTIDSPATPVFAVATATDACGSEFTLTFNDVKTDGACAGSYSVTRTWTATDACGNSSTASQTINVRDIAAPVISDLPAPTTIDSPATPVFAVATATDASGSAFTLTFNDVKTDGACAGSYSVTRTWTATDGCGNSSTASQTINVQDVTAPVIAALPAPTTIDSPATPVFAVATAIDAGGSAFTLTYNDVRTDGVCTGSYSVTRTWTATDACGNSSTASQTINVQDVTAPVIAALPAPTTIDCPATPVFAVATATDAEGSAFTLTYNDVRTDGTCAGSYSVTRTWTATDACGNSSTASQTINVQDITAPVIADLPAPTTIDCPATPVFAVATATDACDATPALTYKDVRTDGLCAGSYSVTRTWTATDACGNSSTASQTIDVQDITAPVIADLPAPTTIDSPATPVFAVATATDACGSEFTLTFNDVKTDGACAGSYSVTRTWTATDACGNSSTASQTINVRDIAAPVISDLPAPTTIDSPATPVFAVATATDASGSAFTLTFNDVKTDGACAGSYSVTRTWTATDGCGNSSTASQTINVQDVTAPVIAALPAPTTIDSPATPVFAVATAIDAGGSAFTLTYNDVRTDGVCTGSYSVTRTWTATDACGNSSTASQTINVQDVTAPVIAALPAPTTIDCPATPVFAVATATDAEGSAFTLTYNDVRTDGTCAGSYSVTRTWTATDACGNSSTASQTIDVQDKTAPVINNPPANISINTGVGRLTCDQIVTWTEPTATDNCSGPMTFTTRNHAPGDLFPIGTTAVIYTFTDACGNTASCTFNVTVVDNTIPVITCSAPISVNADPTQCNAIVNVPLPTYSDNCGIASVIGNRNDFGTPLTLANHTGTFKIGTTTIQWKVTDIHGNENTCLQDVIVNGGAITLTPGGPITVMAAPGICASANNLIIAPPVISMPCAVLDLTSTRSDGQLLLSAPFNVGVTTITWTAYGANHIPVANCTQTVTVIDDQPPVFVCTLPITHTADAGKCSYTFTPATPVVTDNCPGTLTVTGTRDDNKLLGAAYPVGTTTITWSTTDAHGNTGTCSTLVTVTDNESPVISGIPADISISNETSHCDAVATWNEPSAADNCGTVSSFISDHASGERFPVGTTTVTYTAVDNHGNTQTASFTVTVNDTEPPVISCPPAQVFCKSSNNTYVIPPLGATDNCGINTTLYAVTITGATTRSGSGINASGIFNVGISTINWFVTDIHGNSSFCSTTVTVNPLPTASIISSDVRVCEDATAPVITFTGASGTAPYTFTYSLNGGNNQTITSTGNTATITQATVIPGSYAYTLISVADANTCSQLQSGTATVIVNQPLSAPVAGNSQAICWGQTATQLSVITPASGGTGPYSYQWLSSPDGINNWTVAGTGTTIDPGVLYESVYYKVVSTDAGLPSCGSIESSIVSVTVSQPLTGPSVGNDQTICYNSQPDAVTVTIPVTGSTGTVNYVWQKSSNGTTGWTNVGFTGTSYNPPALTTTTWYKVVGQTACGTVACLNTVKITVQSAVNPGSISSDQSICAGTAPVAFTSASAGSGSGIISYGWEVSPNGTNYTPILSSNSLTYKEVNMLYSDTWYRRVAISTLNGTSCTANSNAVKVTVNTAPPAPTASDQTVCSDGTLTQTLTATATGGTITWYDAATLGNAVVNPTQVGVGSVTYFAQASNGTCQSLTRTPVKLTINAVPAVPIASDQKVCTDGTLTQTLTAIATGEAITWYDAAIGGNQISDPTQVGVGSIKYYAEASNGTCSSLTRTSVTLTINALPIVTAGTYGPVCGDASDIILVGNPAGGIWTGTGVSGNQTIGFVFDPSLGTQTLTYTYTDGNGCSASNLTTISVSPLPKLQAKINSVTVVANNDGVDDQGAFAVCNVPNNITFNSFTDIIGITPAENVKAYQQIIATNVTIGFCNECSAQVTAFPGATGTASLIDPSLPGQLVMKFRAFFDTNNNGVIDAGECAGDWVVYTVTVNPSTGATSFTSGAINLCQGAPDETYTASAANSTSIVYAVLPLNAGVIDPITGVMKWDPAFYGNATITATSTGSCGTTSADQLVTVNQLTGLTAGTYGPVCSDAPGIVLAGSPSGGIWSGAGVTGNQNTGYVFAPSSGTQTLTYTYTNANLCVTSATTIISVTPVNTIALSSAIGTDNQTASFNAPITPITYTTTGATDASVDNLPAGVTGVWSGNVVTISGTPTAVGTAHYTVNLKGGCGTVSANGTINVNMAGSSISVTGSQLYTYTGLAQGPSKSTITGSAASPTYSYSGTGTTVYPASSAPPTNAGSYQVIASVVADANYNGASSSAYPFTIEKALLTVTAGSQSVSYGTAVSTVFTNASSNTSGFVNNESPVITGTVTYATTYTETTAAGTLGIIITPDVSGLTADNYSFTAVVGSITINTSTASVSATGGSFVYDGAPHAGIGSAHGANNEVLPFTLTYNGKDATTYGPSANAPVNAGTYTVTATFAGNNNYPVPVSSTVDLTITQAALTFVIHADNKLVYDGNADAVINYIGFDGPAPFDHLTLGAGAGTFENKNVGLHKLVTATVSLQSADPAVLNNYSWNTKATTYADIISPKAITGSFTASDKEYDGTVTATISSTALIGTISTDNVTLEGTATFNDRFVGTGKTVALNSPYLNNENDNYTITSVSTTTASITRKALTITASDHSKVYGSTFTLHNPAEPTDFIANGLVSTDAVYNVTLKSDGAINTAFVGAYPIKVDAATGPGLNNYDISYPQTGMLNVTPSDLVITANDMTKAYGATITFTGTEFTTLGLVNSDQVSTVTLSSTGAAASATAGTYDIVPNNPATGVGLTNYSITYKNGKLTVGNNVLTVTVDNASRFYGAANPAFNSVITGQQGGDIFTVTYTTDAVPASNVGNYDIVPHVAGANLVNYTLVVKNGVLTVNRVNLTITPSTGQSKIYGTADPGFAYAVSPVGATITGTLSRAGGENVGNYAYTIGTLDAGTNYLLTLSTGSTFSITQKLITITPNAGQTKVYGTTDPSFTYTAAPALNSGDLFGGALLRVSGEIVGPYAYSIGSLTAGPNYTLTVAGTSTFSITPKALNITANNLTKTFGTTAVFAGTEFTTSPGELINGNYVTSVTLASTGAAASATAGTYPIIASAASGSGLGNYTITYHDGTLTVVGKPILTVTANNANRLYGVANPTFTATITGYVNGVANDVTGTASVTTTATASSSVGSYTITAALGTLTSSNYNFTFVNGSLTVGKAMLTVTANNLSKVAGAANPPLTATITGFANGEILANSGVTGSPALTTTASQSSPAGSYPITVTLGTLASVNYNFTFANGTLTVTGKPTLTVTATSTSRLYGAANPAFAATITGFVNGVPNDVTGSAGLTTTAVAGSPVGSYTITAAQGTLASSNYNFTFVNGTLTVGKATLTVKADDKFKLYRTANPTLTATITGFVNGQTLATSGVTGNPSLFTSANTNSPVGNYTITASIGSLASANYNFTFATGTLTIALRATLTVTANNTSRTYGSANPALTVSYTGFINGDTFATSGITGSPSVTTTANTGSPAGSYTISVAQGTLASSRYNFTFVSGTLTVNTAPLTITANNGSKIYGTVKSFAGTEFSVTGLVNGNVVNSVYLTSTGSIATATVGTYPIVASAAAGTGLGNYTIGYVNGLLTVNPATVTITPNSGQSKVYGSADPVFTFTHTPIAGGDVTGLMGRVSGENVGTYAFNLGTLTAGVNYTLSITATPTFTINPMPIMVNAQAQTKRQGYSDPVLTYVSSPSVGSILANGQSVSFLGSLTRVRGESVGTYAILIGSLRNTNYTIAYTGANFTITRRTFNNVTGTSVPSQNGVVQSDSVLNSQNAVLEREIGLNAYPNPFTDHVYFDLQLPADAKVRLDLYNIDGSKLATLYDDVVLAYNHYRLEYVPKNFSSNILLYRLIVNDKLTFTGKLIHK